MEEKKYDIYLAGSCGTDERTFMVAIAKFLREKNCTVYCPWELKIENAWDMPQEEWAKKVFDADIEAMNDSKLIVAISRGRMSSAGTNWEIGYAYGKNIPTHVIQINDEPTSLMTFWGCNNFIHLNKMYSDITHELQWIVDHGATPYHGKSRSVLT